MIGGAAQICLAATKFDPVLHDGAGLTSVEWAWLIGCRSLAVWEIWAGYASFCPSTPLLLVLGEVLPVSSESGE